VYVYQESTGGLSSTFTANGVSADLTSAGTESTWIDDGNYGLLATAADSNGNIDISFAPDPGRGEVDFNGFQITPVPEPTTLSLAGLGAVAALRRRRKSCTSAESS